MNESIAQLVEQLIAQKISVSQVNGELKVKAVKGALTPQIVSLLKQNKRRLIEYLQSKEKSKEQQNKALQNKEIGKDQQGAAPVTNSGGQRIIEPVKREASQAIPLSFSQQRLWFIDAMQGGSPEYNIAQALRVNGPFNVDAGELALSRIIGRHESLRTVYIEQQDVPTQVIRQQCNFAIKRMDLSDLCEDEQQLKVTQLMTEYANKVFDLRQDLMLRAMHIHLKGAGSEQQGVLLFTMHHIATDAWSTNMLVREFVQQYAAAVKGLPDPLPPLSIQYADYVFWQQKWLEGPELIRQRDYWLKQLDELPAVHSIPLDKPRPAKKQFEGAALSGSLPGEVAEQLKQVAQQHGMSLFMLMHGILALVLSRHSNNTDIVLGTPIANRVSAQLKPLIGLFINTLILRANTAYDNLSDYLQHIRQVNLEAQANQDIQFEHLIEPLGVDRSQAYTPLFQILFNMGFSIEDVEGQNAGAVDIDGVSFSSINKKDVVSRYDMLINIIVTDQGVNFNWTYDVSLFSEAHIQMLNDHLQRLTLAVVGSPSAPLADLAMLSNEQQQHLIYGLNDTKEDFPTDKTIYEYFEAHARTHPDAVAVTFDGKQLSYAQMNELANQMAFYLAEEELEPGDAVAICAQRSLELMVALMAIAKAGLTYLALIPTQPKERLKWVLEDSAIEVVLTTSDLLPLVVSLGADVLMIDGCADSDDGCFSDYQSDNPNVNRDLIGDPYILYTSGSTGKPKGVEVTYAGVMDYLQFAIHHYYKPDLHGSYVMTSHGFDIGIPSLWVPLMVGGCVNLAPNGSEIESLAQICLEGHDAYLLRMTPLHIEGLLTLLPADFVCHTDHVFVIGGTVFTVELAKKLQSHFVNAQIYNHYGPTETVVGCAMFDVSANLDKAWSTLPIGRPMSNTQLYVLAPDQSLLAYGVTGELYIGGTCVAKGYRNRPELSAERFVKNPFDQDSNDTLYRTGDLVRYLADGNIEFVGRVDSQVKIRGFRIELGEIEAQLKNTPWLNTALVMVLGDKADEQTLVAYVVPNDFDSVEEADLIDKLESHLQDYLPDYMCPAAYVVLQALPLNPNGKLDKKALPAPDASFDSTLYIALENDIERTLAEIWSKILGVEVDVIGRTANFFKLGGHSMLGLRLLTQINQHLNVRLTVNDIFAHQDLQAQASLIDSKQSGEDDGFARAVATAGGSMVQFNASIGKPNIFCIHAGAGTAFCFRELVVGLADIASCYGVNSPLIYDHKAYENFPDLVAYYLELIRLVQPSGKIYLLGYSLGGDIAYEIAAQLKAAGQEAYVGLIDSVAATQNTDSERKPWYAPIQRALLGYRPFDFDCDWSQLDKYEQDEGIEFLANQITSNVTYSEYVDLAMIGPYLHYFCDMERLRSQYTSPVADIDIDLFKAADQQSEYRSTLSETLNWDKYCRGNINVIMAEGTHMEMINEPYVAGNTEKIKLQLLEEMANDK